jgi:hypothetical protein
MIPIYRAAVIESLSPEYREREAVAELRYWHAQRKARRQQLVVALACIAAAVVGLVVLVAGGCNG